MPERNDTTVLLPSQAEFRTALHKEARLAVRAMIESVMREELTQFLQAAPYERKEGRAGYRNGSYGRDLITSTGILMGLQVPRDRAG